MEYVIIFYDGSQLLVSKEIIAQINDPKNRHIEEFKIGSSTYARSSIAKKLSLDDYFKQYPQERPEERQEWKYQEIKPMTAEEYKRMNNRMLAGLQKFIDENRKKGIEVLKAEQMYERCKNSQIDKNAVLQTM